MEHYGRDVSKIHECKQLLVETGQIFKSWLTLALYRDAHSGRRVKAGRGVRARSI